jgi:hypothetical protein
MSAMGANRSGPVTLIVGSILFLAAAFSPISRVFSIRDPGARLDIIAAAPTQWLVAQALFAAGALVAAAGIALVAYRLRHQPVAGGLAATAALMGTGALLWSWHVYLRAADPARFVAGDVPVWLFAGYSLLTIAGLAVLGKTLLRTRLPRWLGRLCIGSAGLFLVMGILFQDLPPFVYYLVTLAVGVAVLRTTPAPDAAVVPIARGTT